MDKKIAGLLGAAAALTTMTAAQAVAEPTPKHAVAKLSRFAGTRAECPCRIESG
jgi:hypothetical protein